MRKTMKRKKKEIVFYVITIFSCLIAMTVVVTAALLIYDRIQKKNREKTEAMEAMVNAEVVTYTQEEIDLMLAEAIATAENTTRTQVSSELLSQIESNLKDGKSVVETLRPLYPDQIVVVSNSQFHFVPIRDDLRHHNLLQENIQVLESGEMQYLIDGNVTSHKGIDVSKYQGDIDWKKVAESGVEYAFIRVGVRGYGQEGKVVLDEKFESNLEGATEAGIQVGVYFFSQAITDEEALEEAQTVLAAISGYSVTYPIVYDVEKTGASEGRMNKLSVEDRTRMARIFIDKIKEAGYTPMIYSNMEMWTVLIDMASFEDVDKWFAYYNTDLYFPYEYAIWQYTDKGTIDGIKGEVDLNISFKEW